MATAYIVDITKSDPYTHTYCFTCYAQIPDFLRRHTDTVRPDDWATIMHTDFNQCENCGVTLNPLLA